MPTDRDTCARGHTPITLLDGDPCPACDVRRDALQAVDLVFQHHWSCWPCLCFERRDDEGRFKPHEPQCPRHLKKLLEAPDAG